MKLRKQTVITIDPATNVATITLSDGYQIRHYTAIAKKHPNWQLVSAETNKRGKIISVQYSFPEADIRFKKHLDEAELARKQQSVLDARKHQRRGRL